MPVRERRAEQPFNLPAPPAGWGQKPAGISLCMIVKNEERFLAQCLSSVRDVVDEINIVDTGSTDRTVEIARSFGANVSHADWRDDFAWARNLSLEMATKRWILQLDADEELDPDSRASLQRIGQAQAHLTGLFLRCVNRSDQYAGGGGRMSHAIVRIFPNHERIRFVGRIHEFASLDGSPSGLDANVTDLKIVHYGYLSDVVKERDKYTRNMEIVKAAIEAEPENPFHWYNYGVTAYVAGDGAAAIEGFERMWELGQNQRRAFLPNGLQVLADAYNELSNQPEKGLQAARRALGFSPNYANAHFSAGKALLLLGRYEESREMYRAAIEDARHSENQFVVDEEVSAWKAHSEIGSSYALEGNYDEAVAWFRRGLQSRPKVVPLRLNLARTLETANRLEEAEAEFRAIYADNPGEEQCIVHAVNFLLRHGKEIDAVEIIDAAYDKAGPEAAHSMLLAAAAVTQRLGRGDGEAYLREAVRLSPGSAEAIVPLEHILEQRGDSQGIASLRAAEAATAPKTPADYLRRSHLALQAQNYEEALEHARSGVEQARDDDRLQYNAAVALVKLDRKDAALSHLAQLARTHPDAYLQGKYLEAVVARETGDAERALRAVEQVLETAPDQLDAALLRCTLLEGAGRIAETEAELQRLMPSAPKRVGVELAGLYVRLGRLADAKAVAERALA